MTTNDDVLSAMVIKLKRDGYIKTKYMPVIADVLKAAIGENPSFGYQISKETGDIYKIKIL